MRKKDNLAATILDLAAVAPPIEIVLSLILYKLIVSGNSK